MKTLDLAATFNVPIDAKVKGGTNNPFLDIHIQIIWLQSQLNALKELYAEQTNQSQKDIDEKLEKLNKEHAAKIYEKFSDQELF